MVFEKIKSGNQMLSYFRPSGSSEFRQVVYGLWESGPIARPSGTIEVHPHSLNRPAGTRLFVGASSQAVNDLPKLNHPYGAEPDLILKDHQPVL